MTKTGPSFIGRGDKSYQEKASNLPQGTDKQYHIELYQTHPVKSQTLVAIYALIAEVNLNPFYQ